MNDFDEYWDGEIQPSQPSHPSIESNIELGDNVKGNARGDSLNEGYQPTDRLDTSVPPKINNDED